MKNYNKPIGFYGEDLSVEFLKERGYKILERNFTCSFGEVDIIALKNNIISFIEVKSRFTASFGKAKEAVTCYKQKKIIKVSKYYLHKKNLYDYYVRFDVIEIYLNLRNSKHQLIFLEDAFRL